VSSIFGIRFPFSILTLHVLLAYRKGIKPVKHASNMSKGSGFQWTRPNLGRIRL